MKAYILHGVNKLHYDDIEKPNCPEDWAIIKVKAAGICSSDIARIFTKGTYHFPTIPGHEVSGIVYSVGSRKYQYLVGEHVGIFPLIPCKSCSQCMSKHYEMCNNYDYIGSRRDGGFAEYVAVPIWNLVILPKDISFTSAALLEPLAVAHHAMKLGNVSKGNTIGIIGTGMIGISAALWAYKFGAKEVTVIGRNESKRKLVEDMGIKYDVIDENNIREYDIVLEAVGTSDSINQSISHTSPGGTVILMGNPSSDILLPQDIYWRILRKQIRAIGTWNSSYDGLNTSDWTETVKALQQNEINVEKLISHTYTQENLFEGLSLMRNHTEPYCKIMTIWGNE